MYKIHKGGAEGREPRDEIDDSLEETLRGLWLLICHGPAEHTIHDRIRPFAMPSLQVVSKV